MLVLHDMVELRLNIGTVLRGGQRVLSFSLFVGDVRFRSHRGRLFHNREGRVEWDVVLL